MKVLVTGGTGLVGKAIENISRNYNYEFVFLSSKDCDLTNYHDTEKLFQKEKPDLVIHLAANVGGLFKNMKFMADILEDNLKINLNVLKCCHLFKVKKLISCLSTCIFPDKTSYPINENMLHEGPPHLSNFGYAYSKRILEIQSRAYREQYDDNFICIIPTNIYGEYDNFSLTDGHVIPALIHKCYLAKKNNEKFVVKGSGKPLRQFIYSRDLAELILWTLEKYNEKDSIILSVGEEEEVSIEKIGRIIAKSFDYENNLIFDKNFSDGQYKKTADNSKLLKLYGKYKFTNIDDGIDKIVNWFVNNYNSCRK
tara:strand:- start:119 stop:1051 length:933 start_codon:yes stop_codon:yes gene_type:complete